MPRSTAAWPMRTSGWPGGTNLCAGRVCALGYKPFRLKARYGREEILAQIKAARAAGVNDWLFWNAGSRYNPAHYPDEQELAALEAVPPELPREEEKPLTEGEPAGKEVLAGEPLTEEPAAGEPLTGEPLTEEPGTGEPSTGEPVTEELSTGDLLEDQAGGEETTGAPAPGEEPAGGNDGRTANRGAGY